MTDITGNIARVSERIAAACARVGRDPHEVVIVAVSKQQPASAILEAARAGMQHFGENRVEEAVVKIPSLAGQDDFTWHMIGHIQSRKAKDVPGLFDVVHSVDSVRLAQKLSERAQALNLTLPVLLQMNVSGEDAKSGFDASRWSDDVLQKNSLWQEVQTILQLPSLAVHGLMTMAPVADDMEQVRPVFRSLASLRRALTDSFGVILPELSMGMTDDFPVAIEEGATLVRIGRAIFGDQ